MRFLFFLVVVAMLGLWTAYYLRPLNRRISNLLYLAGAILFALSVAGWLRLI